MFGLQLCTVIECFGACALQEQKLGQKFVVDATLTTNLESAGTSDDLKDSVDYAAVYM